MWKRQRLFHAMDFQSLMYPCFTICRIFGMFPYKINASTYESSKPHYIVSTTVTCVYSVLQLTKIYNIMILISKQNFEQIIKGISGIIYLTLNNVVIIITYMLSSPQMHLLQTMSEISQEVSLESYQKLSRLIHAKDIFGIIFLITQVCTTFYQDKLYKLNYISMLMEVFSIYLHMFGFEIIMLYINCVCVLKACFKRINDNLIHVQRLVVNDIKSSTTGLICHIQRNQILLLKLKALKEWHLKVNDTVQMLNTIFGLQLLVIIVRSFTNFTFDVYSDVVRWQDGVFISFDIHYLDMLSSSTAHYALKITLLVWACQTGKNQAQEISTTVHDVLNNINDEQIKNELQLYSLQILHHKNIFSAKGFTIDASLLTSVSN
ncbi:hypothetical protein ALC62_05450 [Cyphomyrmex costatus]|uniref:Gustatory receptor n=1 Tax=Cyphomyrmex costatus TaxID=456900 RepID=A0A195CUD7_9HYME|nr:hypothetical protein ALC62_05450 [Cyphomyrmex costatus]